ncbi:hypothetical protein FI667_g1299, partial [Globisporangium splendens]
MQVRTRRAQQLSGKGLDNCHVAVGGEREDQEWSACTMASLSAKIELSTKGIPINWDGRNWEYYKAMMMVTFGESDLLEISTGTLKEGQTWDDARKAKFKRQQAKIFRMITSSLNMNLANRFLNHKSGSDI